MATPDNIFLVGPMGAGKSTIGSHLARELGKSFRDSDREIESRTGASIPLIFELEHEEGFRHREKAVIDELTSLQNLVLATGGGAVLDPENRSRLCARGFVIYLCAPLSRLVERTHRDKNRPLLQNVDPRERMIAILKERDPLYREIADLIMKTDHRTVRSVVRDVKRRITQA